MTVEEAKDRVAKKHVFDNWHLMIDHLTGRSMHGIINDRINEAMLLYAQHSTPVTKEDALKKLASILESAAIRKYTCVNGFGYSKIERDIVDALQLPSQYLTKEGETLYRKVLTYDKQPQKRGLYDTDMGSLAFNWYNDGYGKIKNEWYDNNTNIQKFPTYWLEELPSTPAAGQEERK